MKGHPANLPLSQFPDNVGTREACAAALALLLYGGSVQAARLVLEANGCRTDQVLRGEVAHTARVCLSPRKRYEATAGCATDAFIHALRGALGAGDDETAEQPDAQEVHS